MASINTPDPNSKPVGLFGIRGRNGSDPPFTLPDHQCRKALNVDFFQSSLGRKRGGAATIGITGGTAFGSGVRSIFRHVPSFNQGAAEMWATDGAGLTKVLKAGTAWADVTFVDAISGSYGEINAVSFNGKLVYLYDSAVNRAHVWDPVAAKVRRMGLAQPAAATVANTGSGTYASVPRWYKVCYTVQVGGVTTIRSNVSATVQFTPSGSGTAARVTKPAAISEDETHWEIYGSTDDSEYFKITTLAVGTTTYDDSALPSTYDGDVPPDDGANTPPPSAKFCVADDARVVFAGAWETTAGTGAVPTQFRIWWTSILGASDVGDDERISITTDIKSYADIEEAPTGISKPIEGAFYVFSYDSQWKFVSTGSVFAPYLRFRVAGGAGCIHHKTIVVADDEDGDPATYFLNYRGPMRIGKNGQQWLGEDVLDIWRRINLDSTSPPHAIAHQDLHQVWFYIPVDGSNTPNYRMVFDTRLGRFTEGGGGVRNGWSEAEGLQTLAYCSCMFSDSLGASMGRKLKPHIGYVTSTAVWKCDTTDMDDAGNTFQAYVESKPLTPWGLGHYGGTNQEPHLVAKVGAGVTVQLSIIRDEGAETTTSTASLAAVSDGAVETRVFPQFLGAHLGQAKSMALRVGDAAAIANTWNLDALVFPTELEGDA